MLASDIREALKKFSQIDDNKYLELYCDLISKNLTKKQEKYKTQSHHIIPKSLYKINNLEMDNSRNNVVNLLYKDHILAHYYLCLCSLDPLFRYYMFISIHYIKGIDSINVSDEIDDFVKSLDEYQVLYEENIKYHGRLSSERNKGFKFSEESRKKISEAMKKEKQDMIPVYIVGDDSSYKFIHRDELDNYISLGYVRGRPKSISNKIGDSLRGKSLSPNTIDKLKEAHKGSVIICMGDQEKHIHTSELDKYLTDGWTLGRSSKSKHAISSGSVGKPGTFSGKEHTDEARAKIGIKNSGGKYVHKGDVVKHISIEDVDAYLEDGWVIGNSNNGSKKGSKCWVTNGVDNKLIKVEEVDEYILDGWTHGRNVNKDIGDISKEEFENLLTINL